MLQPRLLVSCSDSSGRSDIRSRSAPERNPSAICIGEDARRGRGNPRIYFGQAETPTSVARARQPSDAPSSWGSQSPHRSLSDRRNTWCPHPCGSCPYDVRSAHSARGDVRPKQLTKAIGDEPTALQPLGVERHAKPVVPENFQKIAPLATKHVQIASEWIALQPCWTCRARLFMPRRISVAPVANQTRTPDGGSIILAVPSPRAAMPSG